MAHLELKNINKIYPNGVQAVFDFNLDIQDREFIVLVGPSGCGKSTTLRMIAGLESISTGDMILNGVRINDKAPADRDIAMIFQDYALYGNMTVYENMGFSLMVRKENTDKMHDAILATSKIVELESQLNRMPKNLSGGQRQRVALGRSIVRSAEVFLMDEPLSNLDAKLRLQTRKEIVQLHNRLKATIVYVTHDQIEAMTMATRIVVMNHGYVQQIGTPFDVYNTPENMFVASFIGTPPMNLIHGRLEKGMFISQAGSFALTKDQIALTKAYEGKPIVFGIRPESLSLDLADKELYPNAQMHAKIDISELLGATTTLKFYLGNESKHTVASVDSRHEVHMHDNVTFAVKMDKGHFFDPETEKRIR